jgi:hypothetical protein
MLEKELNNPGKDTEWGNSQDHMVEKLWFVNLQRSVSVPDAPKETWQGIK